MIDHLFIYNPKRKSPRWIFYLVYTTGCIYL